MQKIGNIFLEDQTWTLDANHHYQLFRDSRTSPHVGLLLHHRALEKVEEPSDDNELEETTYRRSDQFCEPGIIRWANPDGEYAPIATLVDAEELTLQPHFVCQVCLDAGYIEKKTWRSIRNVEGEERVENAAVQIVNLTLDDDGATIEPAEEIRGEDGFVLRDSGERQVFGTGAQRDTQNGKGRFDLIPPMALRRVAVIFEKGARKYNARNWELGIPMGRFLDSALRHTFDYMEGKRDEDHLAQACWNLLCAIATEEFVERGIVDAGMYDVIDYTDQERARADIQRYVHDHPTSYVPRGPDRRASQGTSLPEREGSDGEDGAGDHAEDAHGHEDGDR